MAVWMRLRPSTRLLPGTMAGPTSASVPTHPLPGVSGSSGTSGSSGSSGSSGGGGMSSTSTSWAPRSQPGPCGRDTSRWSPVISVPQRVGSALSRAGLPSAGACVLRVALIPSRVTEGAPLAASGPICGLVSGRSSGPDRSQDASSAML